MSRSTALDALEQGLALALAGIRELREAPDPEEWVSQKASPLGRRRHCELARANVFPSGRKADGLWLVRRKDLDAYIERHPAADTAAANDARDEAEAVAKRLAYRSNRKSRRSAA